MNIRRHSLFPSNGFRPALLAALACCCLLAVHEADPAAAAEAAAVVQPPSTAPAPSEVTPRKAPDQAPEQEAPAASSPATAPPTAEAMGASGVDEQGRASWRTLETGLLFGEFQLNDSDAKLTVVRIDPAYFDFTLCSRSQDGGPPRPLSQWGEQYDLAAAINASMYLPDRSTSTGYMRQGAHVNNGRVVQRFGAFFVAGPDTPALPSAAILDRDAPLWRQTLDHYSLVIQNYRMINADRRILWSPGGPHYSISAVAQDGDGQILFMHCRQPVEAYSFAQQVLHLPLNVRTVMYVEGGGQAGLLVRSASLTQELVGLNPGGFLVTGDLRAVLPNILGARRKTGSAGAVTDAPARTEAPVEAAGAQPQNVTPQTTPTENRTPEAAAGNTGSEANAPSPARPEQNEAAPSPAQPDAAQPEANIPTPERSESAQPGANQPGEDQPGATLPDTATPPDAMQTGTRQSGAMRPDTTTPSPTASAAAHRNISTDSPEGLSPAAAPATVADPPREAAEPLTEPATSLVHPASAPPPTGPTAPSSQDKGATGDTP